MSNSWRILYIIMLFDSAAQLYYYSIRTLNASGVMAGCGHARLIFTLVIMACALL